MRKNVAIRSLASAILLVFAAGNLHARAARTTYPVVFAHGMAGFDDLLGYDYWGDDYGTFVGDPCDECLEVSCNSYINALATIFGNTIYGSDNDRLKKASLDSRGKAARL